MAALVTGVAGFIGFHVAHALAARGEAVIGIDSMQRSHNPALTEGRRKALAGIEGFTFAQVDVADAGAMERLFKEHPDIDRIVHLAGQAGVRYSVENPYIYLRNNIEAFVVLLETCRALPALKHLAYASSSSVYGANAKLPFSIEDRTDSPVSLYGATKKAMEVIGHSHARMYGLRLSGLRFFTVYGPWGRPDMAAYMFTEKIIAGTPIQVYNRGEMRRDFTYIDDIVAGILGCLDRPPAAGVHRVYNLGNNRSEDLTDFIAAIERAAGRKAIVEYLPMQPGDMTETYADIEASRRDFGFAPQIGIGEGMARFVAWYRDYYRL
ncbi:MAG: NAD-dependent epimerase/dehydratase family protein [Rhodospirillales bacterium]|nr:NAD-dependent epimerase/dehydratase family protein [Rhodospirillales bacterium]